MNGNCKVQTEPRGERDEGRHCVSMDFRFIIRSRKVKPSKISYNVGLDLVLHYLLIIFIFAYS